MCSLSISELSTKAIAGNNVAISLQGRQRNPYILYKAVHEMPAPSDERDRLFDFQRNILRGNTYAADLLVRKSDGVIRSTSKALSNNAGRPTDPETALLSVYNAAGHAQSQTGSAGLNAILPLLERRPTDIGLMLTAVQLYVSLGKIAPAIATVEKTLHVLDESISEADQDIRFNPGLLSVLISLYKREGQKARIRTELRKAASHWRSRSDAPLSLLRTAAATLLDSSDRTDTDMAAELFQSLYQRDETDLFAIAGDVASHATVDLAKVEPLVNKLPLPQDLAADVDVDALERNGVLSSSSTAATAAVTIAHARKRTAAGEGKPGDGHVHAPPAKRIRKSRLPKDYDPNKTPDPERWLPLRDRSTYKPKGRKGKQKAAERMQGGVVSEKAEESGTSQRQQGGGGASKKKKKGKR